MKGIVIPVNGDVEVREFPEPLWKSLGEAVGGFLEIVRPKRLPDPMVMIVNEEGLLRGLRVNTFGSYLYDSAKYGSPIVGTIVIMKEGMTDDGPDIVGLTDEEVEQFRENYGV